MGTVTASRADSYALDGYVLEHGLFSPAEARAVGRAMDALADQASVKRVLEADASTVRSVFAPHQTAPLARAFARSPRVLRIVHDLIGSPTYIYQSKYNLKEAFRGDVWEWHQDFMTWEREDGLSDDALVTAMLFLDEVTSLNAPLLVIPGSQRQGVIAVVERPPAAPDPGRPWLANHSAQLKYVIPEPTLTALAREGGVRELTGPAGSVCFFHSSLVHGSTANISPYPRAALFATYSQTSNVARGGISHRPDFIVERQPSAIEPISDADFARLVSAEP